MSTLPEPRLPEDLAAAFAARPDVAAAFAALPPAQRTEHVDYVEEVRRPEARARRIERTLTVVGELVGR